MGTNPRTALAAGSIGENVLTCAGASSARWTAFHHNGINLVMTTARRAKPDIVTPRTIRFPERLRQRIAADAERCGRSFDAQVVAILRRHYGEDVDIAPPPDLVVALARGSVAGLSAAEIRELTQAWNERGER